MGGEEEAEPRETDHLKPHDAHHEDDGAEADKKRRLSSVRSFFSQVEAANKMLFHRLMETTRQVVASETARKYLPFFLLAALLMYLVFGAATLSYLETPRAEHINDIHRQQRARERRISAQSMMNRIFNDTKKLLIIIDREQTDRVNKIIFNSLAQFEANMQQKEPSRVEWSLLPSFNYALSQLLTIGEGRTPRTTAGQIFLVPYTLLGVPLLFITIGAFVRITFFPFWQKYLLSRRRTRVAVILVLFLLLSWLLFVPLIHHWCSRRLFWPAASLFFFNSITAHQAEAAHHSHIARLLTLLATTVTIGLVFLLALIICHGSECCGKPEDKQKSGGSEVPPTFTLIVDESGESHLAAKA